MILHKLYLSLLFDLFSVLFWIDCVASYVKLYIKSYYEYFHFE